MPIAPYRQHDPDNEEQPWHPLYHYAYVSDREEGLILGVNILGHPLLVELEEQSKEGGVAVSAATISEFMASQPVVSIGRQTASGLRIAP